MFQTKVNYVCCEISYKLLNTDDKIKNIGWSMIVAVLNYIRQLILNLFIQLTLLTVGNVGDIAVKYRPVWSSKHHNMTQFRIHIGPWSWPNMDPELGQCLVFSRFIPYKTLTLSTLITTILTLWSLNLPLSSSSATSRELLSQFSSCSGWGWFRIGGKIKENCLLLLNQFYGIVITKPLVVGKLSLFLGM